MVNIAIVGVHIHVVHAVTVRPGLDPTDNKKFQYEFL